MKEEKPSFWRWIALFSVIFSIAFSYISNTRIISGQNNADISARYNTLFTPAGYAFAIWGLIYLTVIAYSFYQVLPARRNVPIHDQLAIPLTVLSLLSVVWLVLFNTERLLASVVVITGMLAASVVLVVRSREWAIREPGWNWISVPFSLYAGWLTVATIANAAVFLTGIGWEGEPLGPVNWTVLMIAVAVIIAILVSWRLRDAVFPMVVAWAVLAIWVARHMKYENIALVALMAVVVLTAWSAFLGIRLLRSRPYRTANG
jgi:hypothetical protein